MTGVQTCALPILALAALGADRLSVPVRSLRQVGKVLATRARGSIGALAKSLLAATRSSEVRALLAAHRG